MDRILLVEDDRVIVETLTAFLITEGFSVSAVSGQQAALAALETQSWDLLLVDISLADGNGFAVCQGAKRIPAEPVPVIFLTASGDEYSVVSGLEMGAEDYIAKPFRPRELAARIHTVLRRCRGAQRTLRVGDLAIDIDKGIVRRDAQEIYLSALEYRLLLVFVNNRGVVLSRSRLLEEIWDAAGDFVNDNTLTVYIKRLREKLGEDRQIIQTVRGMGYRME